MSETYIKDMVNMVEKFKTCIPPEEAEHMMEKNNQPQLIQNPTITLPNREDILFASYLQDFNQAISTAKSFPVFVEVDDL
jgi:hypothetical protein